MLVGFPLWSCQLPEGVRRDDSESWNRVALNSFAPSKNDVGQMAAGTYESVQACDTDCQDRKTDCVLACDGHVPCEKKCQANAEACVSKCAAPDDGLGDAGTPPKGKGGDKPK
jgi:hypothetical protein